MNEKDFDALTDVEIDNLLLAAGLDPTEIEKEATELVRGLKEAYTPTRCQMFKRRAVWYAKQLFPLRYESKYREGDLPRLTIWRMWLGRCFNVRSWILAE